MALRIPQTQSLVVCLANKGELRKHLEQALLRDLRPDVEVDMDIVFHEHKYREDWKKKDDDSEQD